MKIILKIQYREDNTHTDSSIQMPIVQFFIQDFKFPIWKEKNTIKSEFKNKFGFFLISFV